MPSWLKRSRQSAPPRWRRRPTAMKEAGPESCARGLPMHGIEPRDGPACADGRDALRLDASWSTHAPPRVPRRIKRCHLPGSHDDVRRRRDVAPRLCEHRPGSLCTCAKRRHAIWSSAHTGSVEVSPPLQHGYGTCTLGPFRPTVCAMSVERPGSRAGYASYLSVPGLRWRGTDLRRSTGTSGTRTRSYRPPRAVAWERG